jgi:ADP-ribose pyrophosphatase YjhB (NUDIX family)
MAQRGFIFAVHPTHGLLLLRAYKKKKGVHHQLPGGRVDADELEHEDAHRRAAVRELREETGIAAGPARLKDATDREGAVVRRKNREYFFLELRDADGAGPDRDHDNASCAFTLALSGEHTGFTFERDLAKAENMIRLHSGGENALALRALRGGRGDARELLATTRARPDQPIHQAAQRGDVDALRRELEKNGVTRNE